MNLLIICIDRYLSVTFPVKYRNKRKVLHAKLAMLFAWVVSFILWAPWIIGWQYIVKVKGHFIYEQRLVRHFKDILRFFSFFLLILGKKRTVPPNDCYIQFIQDGHGLHMF